MSDSPRTATPTNRNYIEVTKDHGVDRKEGTEPAGRHEKRRGVNCFQGWSKRDKIMIATLAVAEGTGYAMLSLISPLLPPLVSNKNQSS